MDLVLLGISFAIVGLAQGILSIKYSKYKKIDSNCNLTGRDVAKMILQKNDLVDISVNKIGGHLSDNYNNSNKSVNLSDDIYDGTSIASLSVAAHECGHAIQYKKGYIPIKIRNVLVPIVNFGNSIGYIVLVIGFFLSIVNLALIGIGLISLAVVFQLVTLPCEFNASRRGKKELLELGIVDKKELSGVRSMLNAAAFTYVAGLFSSLLEVYRLYRNIDRRR